MGFFGIGSKSRTKNKADIFDDELSSQLKILDARTEEQDIAKLKAQVEQLSLVCKALWEFIKQNQNIDDNELVKKIEQIKQDNEKTEKCTNCGRIINKNHNRCLYCGTQGNHNLVF